MRLAFIAAFALCGTLLQVPALAQGAMIFGTDAASSPDPVSLPTSNDYYFTQGNGANIIATQVPSYWFNKIGGEINYAISASGQSLIMTNYHQLWQSIINAKPHGMSVFLTPGPISFTVPAYVYTIKETVVGAGGGGSDCDASNGNRMSGGGGGGGGAAISVVTVTPGQIIAGTVGAGGAHLSAGGTSSFGSLSATGGYGAIFASLTSAPGAGGGVGSGGQLNLYGGAGSDGQAGTFIFAGNGGSSILGAGGRAAETSSSESFNPGGGGGGAYDPTNSGITYEGGPGGAGAVIVEW